MAQSAQRLPIPRSKWTTSAWRPRSPWTHVAMTELEEAELPGGYVPRIGRGRPPGSAHTHRLTDDRARSFRRRRGTDFRMRAMMSLLPNPLRTFTYARDGRVSRVAKGADCKSAGFRLRRFESYLSHQNTE